MVSNTSIVTQHNIKCPFCGKGEISYTHFSEYYTITTSRISAGSKKIPKLREERYLIHNSCPICKKNQKALKEAIYRGSHKHLSHEDRLKRLKEAGLPARIVG